MRLLTAISIASLVVSTAALVLVLWLVVTEPWAEEESTPTASAAKTAEEAEPNLTITMLEGILRQHWRVGKEAGYPKGGFYDGASCLGDGVGMSNRIGDFKKSFDPKRIGREWELQVTGRYCNGIEFFYINDATGKLSR
jgi:hypothetical protein